MQFGAKEGREDSLLQEGQVRAVELQRIGMALAEDVGQVLGLEPPTIVHNVGIPGHFLSSHL